MTPRERAHIAKTAAHEVGFDLVGVTTTDPLAGFDYYRNWLAEGRAGTMGYLHRNVHLREKPAEILNGARSIICVAMSYNREDAPPGDQLSRDHECDHSESESVIANSKDAPNRTPCAKQGAETSDGERELHIGGGPSRSPSHDSQTTPTGYAKVARYARGRDYHSVIKRRLYGLIELLQQRIPDDFDARPFVDTGPLLERQLAARAGLGWIGKNTLLMNARLGTYLFLGEIVTTLEIEPDSATADHCGTCTRCLDACPTQAFPVPYQMDASRCISYLTIEHRDEIPSAFHNSIGDWLYGCDICQEVCPHNTRAPHGTDAELMQNTTPAYVPLDLLTDLSSGDYRRLTKNSAARRATRGMWERNGEIVRKNQVSDPRLAIRLLRKTECVGTCYFEFLPGRYNGECWSNKSVYIADKVFALIEQIFTRNIDSFDRYAFNEVTSQEWRGIVDELSVFENSFRDCSNVRLFHELLETTRSMESLPLDILTLGEWKILRNQLTHLLREFVIWLKTELSEHDCISILGM